MWLHNFVREVTLQLGEHYNILLTYYRGWWCLILRLFYYRLLLAIIFRLRYTATGPHANLLLFGVGNSHATMINITAIQKLNLCIYWRTASRINTTSVFRGHTGTICENDVFWFSQSEFYAGSPIITLQTGETMRSKNRSFMLKIEWVIGIFQNFVNQNGLMQPLNVEN